MRYSQVEFELGFEAMTKKLLTARIVDADGID
jgi:hypothetical protein